MSDYEMIDEPVSNVSVFFQKPNYVVDRLMRLLDGDEYKVLDVIHRQILGWRENNLTRMGHVSLKLIEMVSGLSRPRVSKALKFLVETGVILKLECPKEHEQDGTLWSIPSQPEIRWKILRDRQNETSQKARAKVQKAADASASKRKTDAEALRLGSTTVVPPHGGGSTTVVLPPSTTVVLPPSTTVVPNIERKDKDTFKDIKESVGAIATDGGAGEEQDRKPATQPATVPESTDLQKQASQGLPVTGNGQNEKPAAPKGKAAKPRKYTPEEEARRVGLAMAYGAYTGVGEEGSTKAKNPVGIWRVNTDPLADQFPDLTGDQFTAFTEWMPTAHPDYNTDLRSPKTIAVYLLEFFQSPQAKLPAVGEYTAKTPIATVKAFFAKGWGRRAYAIAANKPESEWWQIANTEAEQVSNNLWGRLEHNMDARRRVLESEVGEKAKVWLAKMEASHG